jgi:hypothetical protein
VIPRGIHPDRGGPGLAANIPTNAVGVLSRIRTEQRRLTWLVEAIDRPRMPERVLTLLEDSLLSLKEAGDQLEHNMNHPETLELLTSSYCSARPELDHRGCPSSVECTIAAVHDAALDELASHALPEDAPGAWVRAAIAEIRAGGGS